MFTFQSHHLQKLDTSSYCSKDIKIVFIHTCIVSPNYNERPVRTGMFDATTRRDSLDDDGEHATTAAP